MSKIANVIHYIIFKCPDSTKLGATKLNKILWFSDREAYITKGETITNSNYIKKQYGPMVKNFEQSISILVEENKINSKTNIYNISNAHRMLYDALKQPDVESLSGYEVSILDKYINEIYHEHTATSISMKSHDWTWELTDSNDNIPFSRIYVSRIGEVTDDDVAWFQKRLDNGDVKLETL